MARQEFTFASEHEVSESEMRVAIECFEDQLRTLSPAEAKMVAETATRALRPVEKSVPPIIEALTADQPSSVAERVQTEITVVMRSFARRHELLEHTMTASEVAKLLNTSRQTPHDRIASGTLIAVKDRGTWRFPIWQFDSEGEDGVVSGLPDVIRALNVSALAKVSWLTRSNPMLDGATPIECLKKGHVERVVDLASAVGVD